ncbi:hypothetical protein BC102111_00779 [Brevibacterium casei CIP 102111]|uniref:Uncharacterized protein n=1 Tax=Brevibacterium casei CIP 102111 TaxID=1255625 RepID=A0A2H1I3K5_9MICO|nr:hypothetical protein [Brevibacterium sp. XM4083]MCM1012712.1 hypothetical protein [Brevibacterium sp. XM4083]SMX69682.1 hypothetical protein BC102111_00779 [Brevibacterium casei CIP 102111]
MSRKMKKGLTAAEVAKLPPDQWPSWYRPAKGAGRGSPKHSDFSENNTVNLQSGYRSPRVYSAVSAALVAGIVDDRPDLRKYPEALAAWADAEARAALLRRHLDEIGIIDDDGQPRTSLVNMLRWFENSATSARDRLGLDPRSEAELSLLRAKAVREGTSSAVDLDALVEKGREVLDAGPDPVIAALDRVKAEGAQTTPEEDDR